MPKVSVSFEVPVKVIGAAKDHDADVLAFVQAPVVTVQDPPVLTMYAVALLTFTLPVTRMVEASVLRTPCTVRLPLTVRPQLLAVVSSVPV
jgi:hypothetical protein